MTVKRGEWSFDVTLLQYTSCILVVIFLFGIKINIKWHYFNDCKIMLNIIKLYQNLYHLLENCLFVLTNFICIKMLHEFILRKLTKSISKLWKILCKYKDGVRKSFDFIMLWVNVYLVEIKQNISPSSTGRWVQYIFVFFFVYGWI